MRNADTPGLEWFYFGDIVTLLSGDCSRFGEGRSFPQLDEVLRSSTDPVELRSRFPEFDAEEPLLLHLIRGLANAARSNARYLWTKRWPMRLRYHTGAPGASANEIILTGTECVLPLTSTLEYYLENVTGARAEITEYDAPLDPARHLYVDTLLKAYDEVFVFNARGTCEEFASGDSDSRKAMLTAHAASAGPFALPSGLDIRSVQGGFSDLAHVICDPAAEHPFVFAFGTRVRLQNDRERSCSEQAAQQVAMAADYPCGGFP